MKAIGPIPEGFESHNGELMIAGKTVSELAETAGQTPLFVYSADRLKDRVASLREAMPGQLSIHYAMKANPFAPLLELMAGLVDGIDIASEGELAMALSAGADARRISFAGPGKRDSELAQAIDAGVTLNIESVNEMRRAIDIAKKSGSTARLAVRVNPDFDLRGSGMRMGGGAKPFGIDQQHIPEVVREILDSEAEWRGFHIFAGSQALDPDAIIDTQRQTLELAAHLADQIGASPPHVNLGGGFGIPYFPKDEPVDIEKIGKALAAEFAELPASLADTEFAIELGRWLVGEAGVYLTRIIDRKISHGETFLITDGGLHHQLAASGNFGTVVRRNYPAAIATKYDSDPEEAAHIVGCLCTPLDRLIDNAHLPRAEIGDLVAIFCAGAYGATASPHEFLSQGKAAQMLV